MVERLICPLCQGHCFDDPIVLHDRIMRTTTQPFTLGRCVNCGLRRLHPQPDGATLAAAYPEEYGPHARPGFSGRAKGVLERRSVRQLSRYLTAPRRVLDVGCATGDLLLAVRSLGNPDVTGVETSEQASDVARSRGLNVVRGELSDASFPDESFDTVLLSHTLEHVADPVAFLHEVWRILAPEGVVLLWLPNVDSIEARLFGRYWIGYDAPRHLTTFSTGTLGRTLAATGFAIDEVRHESIGLEWAWALRLLAREKIPAVERVLSRMHPIVIVAFTPAAMIGSQTGRGGRIRVIARKGR